MKQLFFITVMEIVLLTKVYSQELSPEDLIIESINCLGNTLTDCEIIKREIYLNPGDTVNEEEIENAKIRLQILNLFKSVDLSLSKGTSRGHVNLNITVVEDSAFFSETSIYLSKSPWGTHREFVEKVGHRNLFGRGKILQATISPTALMNSYDTKLYSGDIEYIDPHLLGHKKYFLSTKFDYTFIDDANDRDASNYSTTRYKNSTSYTLNVGRRLFDFSHLSTGLTKSYFTDLDITGTETGSTVDELKRHHTSYSLNYGWNSEDDTYFPAEGSKFDLTYYGSESTHNYSLNTDFKQNYSLSEKNILALTLNDMYFSDFDNYHITAMGLEWAYQFRRAQEGSVTGGRFFLKPSLNYDSHSYYIAKNVLAGILLDTKNFGIVKFTLSYWDL